MPTGWRISAPLPRWARRFCEHLDTHVTRTAGGTVLREVCRACGAELAAVTFASREEAFDALRDLVQSPRTSRVEALKGAEPELYWYDWRPPPFLEPHPSGWGRRRAD
jgi:hypothetical protein